VTARSPDGATKGEKQLMATRTRLVLLAAASVFALAALPAQASSINDQYTGPLATPDEIATETTALHILASPEVTALRPKLVAMLRSGPAATWPDGLSEIDHALNLWTMTLIMWELDSDTSRPKIHWVVDNSPHSWFGHTMSGKGVAGDNPDHIYRSAFVDGAATYEITGHMAKNRPAQLSFEIFRGSPGSTILLPQKKSSPDLGNQISLLRDDQMNVAPDGSFTITVGPERASANGNYLKTDQGLMTLAVRDVLSDWRQEPTTLTIRRVAGPTAPPLTEDAATKKVIADLPNFIQFWSHFNDKWLGGLPENKLVGPSPRDGGWGYLAAGRFNLGEDDGIVITTTDAGARYIGFQVNDAWMIMPADARSGTLSLNNAQVARNPDGSVTYVVSRRDPGVANWITTGGLHQGIVILRWEGVPAGADPKMMVKGVKLVKLANLTQAIPATVPRLDPSGRAAQVAKRTPDYNLRMGRRVTESH
jgi:hypothetical protein